eukprot:1919133-Amphidinium_carterae.1
MLEVLEAKPANAVSIFEADVKVEFAPPQGAATAMQQKRSPPDGTSRPKSVRSHDHELHVKWI